MVDSLEHENQKDIRVLKRMINLVGNNMQIRFMKGHFQAIQNMVRDDLMA